MMLVLDFLFIFALLLFKLIQQLLWYFLVLAFCGFRHGWPLFFFWGAGIIFIECFEFLHLWGVLFQLLLGFVVFLSELLELFWLLVQHFLHIYDMSLLVAAVLRVVWSSHEELQSNGVISMIEISFSIEKVDSVEPVVSPALPNFKITGELSDHLCSWISMIDHFNSVFIFLCLCIRQSFKHFQEHADIVPFGYSITVWVNFESPSQATACD